MSVVVVTAVAFVVGLLLGVLAGWSQKADRASAERGRLAAETVHLPAVEGVSLSPRVPGEVDADPVRVA